MDFLGAVKIKVELEGGKGSEVAFHITDVRDKEILIGTNALEGLGVQVTMSQEATSKEPIEEEGKVVVARRLYIPSHGSAVVSLRCEGECNKEERVLWPDKAGIAAGLLRVCDHNVKVPIMNDSD
ncbi:unnamed protein product [Nippostrongylus brasiliensis]|uniref:TOBE domain-containing protein n=1 Tax=Nippostrongylus brasiliensis TaxID=27835 RepID=A0A0N4YJ27_NIPBR|nr:unnamed protein product [Nippostrongylus brasiliensis]